MSVGVGTIVLMMIVGTLICSFMLSVVGTPATFGGPVSPVRHCCTPMDMATPIKKMLMINSAGRMTRW
jgi:hypothetical protein